MGNAMKGAYAIGFVVGVVSGGVCFGAMWTNVTDAAKSVSSAASWRESVAPAFNDASNPVDICLSGDPGQLQTVILDSDYTDGTWHFGSLEGSNRRRIALNKGNCRRISASDTSDFFGYFRTFGGWCGLYAAGDAGTTLTVRQTAATGRFNFGADAGVTQTVEQLFGYGRFDVNEKYYHAKVDGTVELVDSESGPRLDATVKAGRLVLHGAPYAAPRVVGNPFLHLDASRTDTMSCELADGRIYVDRWNDVRGNGLYAKAETADARPFLSDGCVDFGSYAGSYGSFEETNAKTERQQGEDALGPSGWLRLSAVRSDVKEVFLVFRDNARFKHNAPFFGAPEGANDVFRRTCRWISNVGMLVPNLFGTYGAIAEIAAGDVRVDGVRVEGFSSVGASVSVSDLLDYSRSLHVVSVGLDGLAAIDRLAANGYGTGGLRFAEVILYTNALTSAERRCVNAYLRAKWQDSESSADFDLRSLKLEEPELEVPSGFAKIGRIELDGEPEAFLKTGNGSLAVGSGIDGVSLRIDGGELAVGEWFERQETDFSTPADAPDLWLDADAEASCETVAGADAWADTVWVKQWRDVRDGTNAWGQQVVAVPANVYGNGSAARPYGYGNWPTVSAGPFGRKALDFGTGVDASAFAGVATLRGDVPDGRPDAASFEVRMSSPSSSNPASTLLRPAQRTFFVALRRTAAYSAVFGGETFSYSGDGNSLLDSYQASGAAHGGVWTKNGKVFDASAEILPTDEWMVVGVEMAESVSMTRIAQKNNTALVGGIQVGEMICYDRLLTPAERRRTEAYLMRRWVDADYEPEKTAGISVPSVTFGDGVSPVLAFDCDASIGRVADASGTLVKKGKGAVAVDEALPNAVDSVKALGGGLSVKMSANEGDDGTKTAELVSLVVSNATFSVDVGDAVLRVANLSVAVPLDGTSHGPMCSVAGTLSLCGTVTLDVSAPAGSVPAQGEYLIVEADAIESADAAWSCDLSQLSSRMRYSLVKHGKSVALCVNRPGLQIVVR